METPFPTVFLWLCSFMGLLGLIWAGQCSASQLWFYEALAVGCELDEWAKWTGAQNLGLAIESARSPWTLNIGTTDIEHSFRLFL